MKWPSIKFCHIHCLLNKAWGFLIPKIWQNWKCFAYFIKHKLLISDECLYYVATSTSFWGRESPLDYKKAAHASLVGCNNLDFLFHCWPFLIRLSISNTYTYILRRFIPTPIVTIIRNIKRKTSLGTTTIFRSSISI